LLTIAPLHPTHHPAAAALFAANYARLRAARPELPATFTDPAATVARLAHMEGRALAAFGGDAPGGDAPDADTLAGDQLIGYLCWWQSTDFRRTGRRGAYVPEWGHAARPDRAAEIYRALYRAAATEWAAAANQVHAISLLATDEPAREAWFWNGFGLLVVDAARPVAPLPAPIATPLTIRAATPADAPAIAALDAEHVRHYAAPPIHMAPATADTPDFFRAFLAQPKNSIWLALDRDTPAGFMRFTGQEFDAVAILDTDAAAFCDGLYVRPAYRGRRAAPAMLAAALDHYARLGLTALYTNFESFNPEAAAFWPRHFHPVCYSLLRTPESVV
jgi:ribosomal protein S18 acetylase RimI-like enzyme